MRPATLHSTPCPLPLPTVRTSRPNEPSRPSAADDGTLVFRTEKAPTRHGDGAHYLVVIEGKQRGQRFTLGTAPVTLGRREGLQISLVDVGVSKTHCKLCIVNDQLLVTDLGSTNGTFIDGVRITDCATLPIEGHLAIGSHLLKHEFRSRRQVAAA